MRPGCSQRSGARVCWPMTRCSALTGPGWHWTAATCCAGCSRPRSAAAWQRAWSAARGCSTHLALCGSHNSEFRTFGTTGRVRVRAPSGERSKREPAQARPLHNGRGINGLDLVGWIGQASSRGEKPPAGERCPPSFRLRSIKVCAKNLAEPTLRGAGHRSGEWFGTEGLERAKGFEPSTPTLARPGATSTAGRRPAFAAQAANRFQLLAREAVLPLAPRSFFNPVVRRPAKGRGRGRRAGHARLNGRSQQSGGRAFAGVGCRVAS